MFYSQSGQDRWVDKIMKQKRDGYFLDIGAYDGVQTSNSYFFESERGWTGICIECDPGPFSILNGFRKSKNFPVAVTDYDGTCKFSNMSISDVGIEVPCRRLSGILEEADAPEFIDYLSIDIEGHEFTVLNSLDLDRWRFGAMTVEHNLYAVGDENKNKIYELLTAYGYVRVVEDAVSLDTNPAWYLKPYEDWYVNEEIIKDLDL